MSRQRLCSGDPWTQDLIAYFLSQRLLPSVMPPSTDTKRR